MLKKLGAYLVLAVSCAGEVYLLIPGGYDVFHGGILHTFVGVLGLLGFPFLGIYTMWAVFFRKNTKVSDKSQDGNTEVESATKLSEKRKRKYILMLDELPNKREFNADIDTSKDQINRFEAYLSNIRTLYSGLSHKAKINSAESERAINGAIGIFYRRIESMMACIRLFDSNEYRTFCSGELELKSQKSILEKKALFEKTFKYVDEITDSNEELILAVHKLLSALTEMGLSKEWDNDTILATRRLNDYIKSAEGVTELNSEIGEEIMGYFGKK